MQLTQHSEKDLSLNLQAKKELIEQQLNALVTESHEPFNLLFKAARYSLLGSGKRLRPLLTLVTTETLGANPLKALNAACAIEMIHAYSLIHDDLPCMDDDDFRRGKPSLHKAFDEGHAVLTGDYLLSQAFECIASDDGIPSNQRLALISLLARKSGGEGMIAGQVMDIESEGHKINLDKLNYIHEMKTGALIAASIEFGCIIANATKEHTSLLCSYGREIGLAFQIIDDIIDITASQTKHGKIIPSDAANNKTTYVTIMGLEAAEKQAYLHHERSLKYLSTLPYDTTHLVHLTNALVARKI